MSEKIYLKDYVEPNYFQDKVDIHFSLFDDHCLVSCQSQLTQRRENHDLMIIQKGFTSQHNISNLTYDFQLHGS